MLLNVFIFYQYKNCFAIFTKNLSVFKLFNCSTFQLLNQIAGRSGRANKKGEVYIQVFNTEHYSIVEAANNDYNAYIKQELSIRKKLNYPPYYNLLLLKISGKNEEEIKIECNKIVTYLKSSLEKNTFILGPSTAIIPKVNNIYYYQVILKYVYIMLFHQ